MMVLVSNCKSGFALTSKHRVIDGHCIEYLQHRKLILIEKNAFIYSTGILNIIDRMTYHLNM